MTAALICSVIFLGTGNLLQAAERWHMTDKLGDRLRLVNPPPKQQQQDAAVQPQPVNISERRTGT